MGMSTHVVGFKPPDDKWKNMKKAWDACEKAGINIPYEILEFFDHQAPDDSGVEVSIERLDCTQKWIGESCDGFEVDIKKLPADVTVIRFYNSW